jgi:hypothetical protein
MCSPSLAIAGLGALVSGYSAYVQGQQAQANFEYQAQIAEYNAQVANNNATAARQAADFEANKFDLRLRKLQATNIVSFAKSGVVINQDTPLEIAVENATEGALERATIIHNGEIQANAALAQAGQFRAAAGNFRSSGSAATTAANLRVVRAGVGFGKSLLA